MASVLRPILLTTLLVLALGCDETNPSRSPDPSPPAGGGAAASDCVDKCVDSRAMEARAPEDIRRDCEKECAGK